MPSFTKIITACHIHDSNLKRKTKAQQTNTRDKKTLNTDYEGKRHVQQTVNTN